MPASPARVATFDILLRVEQKGAYAAELLHSSRYAKLSTADHGLATEIVMGVLRWRSWLDEQIAGQSSLRLAQLDLEVLTALRMAVYQLIFLDRIPPHAATDESVELVKQSRKRSAVGFTNAVLRKLARSKPSTPSAPRITKCKSSRELSDASAHPEWLVERWVQEYGPEVARKICAYDQQIPQAQIRIGQSVPDELMGVQLAPGQLLSSARRVIGGKLIDTRAFREGRVVIQDEASQLVASLVGNGAKILDCCAAPGGKTRILAEQNPDAKIVAVELHPHRARLLRKMISAKNVQIIVADVRQLPTAELFDRVLVDAPCSGTGTLARNPEIKWRLKPEDLGELQARQLAILLSAMQRVASGGRLVYSTCSLEREENDAVIESALSSSNSSFRLINCHELLLQLRESAELMWPDLQSLACGPCLRTIPGIHPCDGFFAAILERT